MSAPEIPTDEITEPWWDATRARRLTVQRCAACGRLQHYPRALCTGCGGTDLDFVDVSGDATVDAFTVVHRSPRPDLQAPYVVARVRLAEGPILLTQLEGAEPGVWRCDDPVKVAWRALPDGRHLPVFRPAASGADQKAED